MWKSKEFSDREKKKKENEKATIALRRKEYVDKNPLLADVIKKAILGEKIMLGMTESDVVASWGKPEKVNRSVGGWGVHEQWIYGGCVKISGVN